MDSDRELVSVVESVGEAASQPFVGRWNRLVSTTNWEKGRIIAEWRQALVTASAAPHEFADDVWARMVGGVSGQHVGRLRRVYQRFGASYTSYAGLFWTHFHAALDWDDAELWLEGAVQSGWSVSQMRRQRWESMGAVEQDRPREADVVAADHDEDFDAVRDREQDSVSRLRGELADVQGGPIPEGPDFGDEPADATNSTAAADAFDAALDADADRGATADLKRPFENLADLPDDLAAAFESFKLAILHHKADHWRQILRADVLASLDALKELALAPSAD